LKISEIGIHDSLSDDQKNKIRLLNVFTLIASFVFLISGITNLNVNDTFSGVLLICFCIFSLFTILFNYINQYKVAISYLYSIISFGIFYFDSYAGIDSGSYLYYFPLFLGIANLFDFRTQKDRKIVFVQTFIIISLACINVFTDYKLFENQALKEEQVEIMFKSNLILSLLAVSYFIYYIIKSNLRKLELLEELISDESKLNQLEREKTKEKEILLAEIQHRLKNNLSIISSLIKLKSENSTAEDFNFIQQETWHAIHTIALAHHHQSYKINGFFIPMKRYITEIVESYNLNLNGTYLQPNISIDCQVINDIHIKQAVPFGLFIHECIANFFYITSKLNLEDTLKITVSTEKSIINIRLDSTLKRLFENDSKRTDLQESFLEQLDGKVIEHQQNSITYSFKLESNQPEIESRKIF
jgi:two-component sensor histidine kinase